MRAFADAAEQITATVARLVEAFNTVHHFSAHPLLLQSLPVDFPEALRKLPEAILLMGGRFVRTYPLASLLASVPRSK